MAPIPDGSKEEQFAVVHMAKNGEPVIVAETFHALLSANGVVKAKYDPELTGAETTPAA